MKAQTKALVASLIIVALGLSAVSGITYSWWSDSEDTNISVTTGYVHVETSGLLVKKGGQTVSNVSGSMPDGIEILYSDEGSTTWTTDDEGTKLTITGDPDETIEISYTAKFSWTVEAKYMMGFGSESNELRGATSIRISQDDVVVTLSEDGWIEATGSTGNKEYNVTITINSLPAGIRDANLVIKNYITQRTNDVSIWNGTIEPIVPDVSGEVVVYEIETPGQLMWVSQQVNTNSNSFNGNVLKLKNDIDLSGLEWTPIGHIIPNGSSTYFEGEFDGNGKTISNLNIVQTSDSASVGLFGAIEAAKIHDFTISNAVVSQVCAEKDWSGGIAAVVGSMEFGGTIKNVKVQGLVMNGTKNVGAIVGYAHTSFNPVAISECEVSEAVIKAGPITIQGGTLDHGDKVGGIIGYNYGGIVSECSVKDVDITAYRDVGIIAGCIGGDARIEDCFVEGNDTIVVDQTGIPTVNDPNAGAVVGRIFSGTTMDNNMILGFVSISAKVCNSGQFNKVLQAGISDISVEGNELFVFSTTGNTPSGMSDELNITLLSDVVFEVDSGSQYINAFGWNNTKTVTFDGKGFYKLTFYKPDSDCSHVATNGAELVLKNLTLTDSGYNVGPWNRYDIVFDCRVSLENVNSNKAIALGADATFNHVTIKDDNDVYGLWIKANGQTVNLENVTIEMGTTGGRAIAVKDQYFVNPQKVTLTITDSVIKSQTKAAVLVTSTAGATINAQNVDISGVYADNKNLVWIDNGERYRNLTDTTVIGGTAIIEP